MRNSSNSHLYLIIYKFSTNKFNVFHKCVKIYMDNSKKNQMKERNAYEYCIFSNT